MLLDKAVPLGRVWSFPKDVKCVNVAATIEQYADFVSCSELLPGLATVYYNKTSLDRLQKHFNLMRLEMPVPLPESTGKTINFYRYQA